MNTPLEALERLKELAKAARGGKWVLLPQSFSPAIYVLPDDATDDEQAIASVLDRRNAAFIAAANPQAILDLLTSYEAQGERLREVEGALRPFAKLAAMIGEGWTDETAAFCGAGGVKITVGELRAAALTQPPAMENGE